MEPICDRCGHVFSDHELSKPCKKKNCTCSRFTGRVRGTTGNRVDTDGVDHPEHYNVDPSGIECITIVRHRNFNIGNAIKYLWRAGLKKGSSDAKAKQINDLEKAIWYIQDEIKRIKEE